MSRRTLSIRRLTFLAAVILGLIGAGMAVALVRTSTLLEQTTTMVIRDSLSRATASEFEMQLLTYQRLSNLYAVTRDPALETTRTQLISRMRSLRAEAEETLGSVTEGELLDDVSQQLAAYLDDRAEIDATGTDIEEVVRASQPALDSLVATLESLRDLNDQQVREAHDQALRVNRLADRLGTTAVALFSLVLVTLALGIRAGILRPMLDLHDTISAFRRGDLRARSSNHALHEIDELGRAFNEMADALARQREDQLTSLAGVAHDLRNPLNGLRMGIYALSRATSDEQREQTRLRLDRHVDRLGRMVEDLLDAARIEAGDLDLKIEEFDLRDTVDDVVGLYIPTSPDHSIELDTPKEAVIVQGDPLRFGQVVSNLLSNAIKYTPAGGRIRISVRTSEDRGVVAVADNGIGIPHEELDSVFLPFRRSNAGFAPGTGLGLSVARRITERHGGRIEVESEPGVGSTFRVRIPLASGAVAAAGSQTPRLRAVGVVEGARAS